MASGHEIYTVEALATGGKLAPAQQAMAAAGGSQCGYCTPGFVVSLFAEQYRPGRSGPCDPHELGGNLCRCTGYRPIRDAALALGSPPAGSFLDRLSAPAPRLDAVEFATAEARFSRPTGIADCLAILADDPSAKLIAGGTDLAVESNLRSRRWPHLVSLEAIPQLREFSQTPHSVTIGAALPLSEIAMRWPGAPQTLIEWLRLFASPLIRNRATLGGNLATASPIGDSAPLLLALDADVHLASNRGRRKLPLASFFTGYRRTALRDDELIVSIEIPQPMPGFLCFYKIAKRRMDDISTVAAAMAIDCNDSGMVTRARFAFGGVAAIPLRAAAAEEAILGRLWNEDAVDRARAALELAIRPISDHRGSAEYRRAVAGSLLSKFLCEWREAHGR